MKTRTGFVSNSSSSSFVIACKDELTVEKLMGAFNVTENSPLFDLTQSLAELLIENSSAVTVEDYLEDDYDGNVPESILSAIKDTNNTVYSGAVCDETGDALESALCHMDLSYYSPELSIYKNSSY